MPEVRKLAEVQPLVEAVQASGGCEQRSGQKIADPTVDKRNPA